MRVNSLFVFLSLFFPTLGLAADLSAFEILQKSDRARGGLSDGLSWKVKLENSDGSGAEYDVQVKGVNVIARCFAPARQKGDTFLFNDRNLWVYKPGLKKPVSLSPRQRLSGQAANGDIATTNYARDYNAKIEGKEKIDGKEVYRLFLEAKEKNVTYHKIRYWITKESYLGVKADFLTLEGDLFKSAKFEYKHKLAGLPFVSSMKITDAKKTSDTTVLTYSEPKTVSISDSVFNVNNLSR